MRFSRGEISGRRVGEAWVRGRAVVRGLWVQGRLVASRVPVTPCNLGDMICVQRWHALRAAPSTSQPFVYPCDTFRHDVTQIFAYPTTRTARRAGICISRISTFYFHAPFTHPAEQTHEPLLKATYIPANTNASTIPETPTRNIAPRQTRGNLPLHPSITTHTHTYIPYVPAPPHSLAFRTNSNHIVHPFFIHCCTRSPPVTPRREEHHAALPAIQTPSSPHVFRDAALIFACMSACLRKAPGKLSVHPRGSIRTTVASA